MDFILLPNNSTPSSLLLPTPTPSSFSKTDWRNIRAFIKTITVGEIDSLFISKLYRTRNFTYTQSCLSSLFKINRRRNWSQHPTEVSNILLLQFNASNRKGLIDSSFPLRSPQWYKSVRTSRWTSSLNGESAVFVKQLSVVADKQSFRWLYSCLYTERRNQVWEENILKSFSKRSWTFLYMTQTAFYNYCKSYQNIPPKWEPPL